MQGLRCPLAALVIAASATLFIFLSVGQAQARQQPSAATTGGDIHNRTISARVGIAFAHPAANSGSSSGALTPDGNWTPPACWYAPRYTPQQFQQYYETLPAKEGGDGELLKDFQNTYINGAPYRDFNLTKEGKGYWWDSFQNPYYASDPRSDFCQKPIFWVDTGKAPNVPNGITPELLAELAYQQIRVPGAAVILNPAKMQSVNLNTWAWRDSGTFKPVSVIASLNALGISAKTTATPVSLHLDPGTRDATVYPTSGDCPINVDGSIGAPYSSADGNEIVPPCGFTYLHATTDNLPFQLEETIIWKVGWTGTGNAGGNLPNGTFGTTAPMMVQEVQSVVRGTS